MLLICNEYSLSPSSMAEGSFVLFYIYIVLQALLLILYYIYRTFKIRAQQTAAYTSLETGYSTTTRMTRQSGTMADLFFSGFKRDTFGYFM
jgi:hypothetical protein